MSFRELDLATWPRREHFSFFHGFDEPFFGITVAIDCSWAYSFCKQKGHSFFSCYFFHALCAANAVEPFRYGIREDKVVIYDQVDASPTIMRDDGTFGFGFIPYEPDYTTFQQNLEAEIRRVCSTSGLLTREYPANLLHISALPWLEFSSMSHARRFGKGDSCPKISFGKISPSIDGSLSMPLSIHVHHGLMDGIHVSQFVELFRAAMSGGGSFAQ